MKPSKQQLQRLAGLEKSGREVISKLTSGGAECVKLDGLDGAVIGSSQNDVLVYDRDLIIEILVIRDGMTTDEACEFISFNIDSAFKEEKVIILDR